MSLIMGLHSPRRLLLIIAAGFLVVAATSLDIWYFQPRPMWFDSTEQFKDFALQHGLFVHSGRSDPELIKKGNFFVADHAVKWEQLPLHKVNCGQTANWKGLVWVTRVISEQEGPPFGLHLESVSGHVRIWGNLLAAGDPELLDHLEALYHQR